MKPDFESGLEKALDELEAVTPLKDRKSVV